MMLKAKSGKWLEPQAFRAKELIVLYIPPFPPCLAGRQAFEGGQGDVTIVISLGND